LLPKPDRTGFGHKFGQKAEEWSENWARQTDFGNLSDLSIARWQLKLNNNINFAQTQVWKGWGRIEKRVRVTAGYVTNQQI
jgi:hypothetical protein